jgi:hypothetical protein
MHCILQQCYSASVLLPLPLVQETSLPRFGLINNVVLLLFLTQRTSKIRATKKLVYSEEFGICPSHNSKTSVWQHHAPSFPETISSFTPMSHELMDSYLSFPNFSKHLTLCLRSIQNTSLVRCFKRPNKPLHAFIHQGTLQQICGQWRMPVSDSARPSSSIESTWPRFAGSANSLPKQQACAC